MRIAPLFVLGGSALLMGTTCMGGGEELPPIQQQTTPTPRDTVVIRDTVVVTREVEPPLPEGDFAMLCLATGENVEIRISAAGDTMIGPRRVRLTELGPAVAFAGDYAGDDAWFVEDEAVTFERQRFSKFGQPEAQDCRSVKIVGEHQGVNLFAELTASSPFRIIFVPVSPGVFQPYQQQVGRVRG